jgi:hypothetical protein
MRGSSARGEMQKILLDAKNAFGQCLFDLAASIIQTVWRG